MIATWMLYGTIVAILAGIGAVALERGARLLGRAGRWCWVGAMLVTLALPVVAWVRPITPTRTANAPAPAEAPVAMVPAVAPATPVIPAVVASPPSWADFDRPLAWGWGVLSLGLMSWFAVGWMRLGRMRRSWRSEDGVFVSKDVGPAVIGFLRCQVVVPEWSLQLATEQRELLLAHEAEHLSAHDARLLLLSATVLALVPWNPGLWWQFRRLRLAIELDCDQRVLRRRPDPATYGRLLLDVGARASRSFVPVAAFHEPVSSLETRIRSITSTRRRGAGVLAGALVVIAGGAFFGACEAPRPTAPAEQKQSFTFQTREEEGRITSKYIADSVRHYFGSAVTKGPVYLWFIVTPDGHVVRYGTTSRNPSDNVIRSQAADTVVPGFTWPRMQSVTIVGENAIVAGSQPIYWAVLRDPNRPYQEWHDTSYNAMVPWVGEAMRRYYPGLLAAASGAPVEVWFVSDSAHHVLRTTTVAPHLVGARPGPIHNLSDVFPDLTGGIVSSITGGATQGWARDHVTVVWVTQTGRVEGEQFHSDTATVRLRVPAGPT